MAQAAVRATGAQSFAFIEKGGASAGACITKSLSLSDPRRFFMRRSCSAGRGWRTGNPVRTAYTSPSVRNAQKESSRKAERSALALVSCRESNL
jgi:hypothetical protein